MIDLHLHSTFSDGMDTPSQLNDNAEEIRLTAIALTDHDMNSCVHLKYLGLLRCSILPWKFPMTFRFI